MSNQVSQYVSVEERDGVTIITIKENKILNDQIIEGIWQDLRALLEEESRKRVIIDFRMVEFVSSSLLGKLISFKRMITARNGSLMFCGMNAVIYETLFLLTNLFKVFNIRENIEEAIDSMS